MKRNRTAKLSFERCRELFEFYPNVGLVRRGTRLPAGTLRRTKARYPTVCVDGVQVLSHCVIWLLFNDSLPEAIDHINGDRFDNRIENLRAADKSLNEANTGPRKSNKLGVKGVRLLASTGKFTAQIQDGPKAKYLGVFPSVMGAAFVYNIAAFAKWGEFAHLNSVVLPGNQFYWEAK